MKKILFVDDEPNVLSAIQRQLHGRFEVQTAVGAAPGLEALQNGRDFSVVVADMGMPKMSGVEFLAKACEMAPDVVRVMLTGYVNQTTAVEAINQGSIFRFLNKPCSTEKLVHTLEAAVAQHNPHHRRARSPREHPGRQPEDPLRNSCPWPIQFLSMENINFTGVEDVDREILLNLDDKDLFTTCSLSRTTKKLCDDKFWYRKFIRTYGTNGDIGSSDKINYRGIISGRKEDS